jgi:hypothetical protein
MEGARICFHCLDFIVDKILALFVGRLNFFLGPEIVACPALACSVSAAVAFGGNILLPCFVFASDDIFLNHSVLCNMAEVRYSLNSVCLVQPYLKFESAKTVAENFSTS